MATLPTDPQFAIELMFWCVEMCQKKTKRKRRYGKKVRVKDCVEVIVDCAKKMDSSVLAQVVEKVVDMVSSLALQNE